MAVSSLGEMRLPQKTLKPECFHPESIRTISSEIWRAHWTLSCAEYRGYFTAVVEEALCISGGVAKNIGIVKRLERNLGMEVFRSAAPQLVGAFGAALIALEKSKSQK